MNISNKVQMYQLLESGVFGNTTKMWFSLESWLEEHRSFGGSLWGIRSSETSGNDKRTRLDIPTNEVANLYHQWYPNGGGQISPMVDHMLTARMHVYDSDTGLVVWIVEGRAEVKWREAFATISRHCYQTDAVLALRKYLNPNSLADLQILLEQYPKHVVELTTLDRCFGKVPHRNAIIWEVRNY